MKIFDYFLTLSAFYPIFLQKQGGNAIVYSFFQFAPTMLRIAPWASPIRKATRWWNAPMTPWGAAPPRRLPSTEALASFIATSTEVTCKLQLVISPAPITHVCGSLHGILPRKWLRALYQSSRTALGLPMAGISPKTSARFLDSMVISGQLIPIHRMV